MLMQRPVTITGTSIFVEAMDTQHREQSSLREQVAALQALKMVITEAFVLAMELKSFHWSFDRFSFAPSMPILGVQAELILAGTDQLVQRVLALSGSAMDQRPDMWSWHMVAGDRDDDEDTSVRVQRLIRDHQHLVQRIREAIIACNQPHPDGESYEALQKLLVETKHGTKCLLGLLEHLPLLCYSREV